MIVSFPISNVLWLACVAIFAHHEGTKDTQFRKLSIKTFPLFVPSW
jgi:hypothetical protein